MGSAFHFAGPKIQCASNTLLLSVATRLWETFTFLTSQLSREERVTGIIFLITP